MVHIVELTPTATFRLQLPDLEAHVRLQYAQAIFQVATWTEADLNNRPLYTEFYPGAVWHNDRRYRLGRIGDVVIYYRVVLQRVTIDYFETFDPNVYQYPYK